MKKIALLLLCLWMSPTAYAETAYVGDNLRVGLRSQPDTKTPPLTIISSGDKLEILEATDKYSRIRTDDGQEGWVRNIYLSAAPPAKLLIKGIQEEFQQAQQEILSLQKELTNSNKENQALDYKIKLLNEETFRLHKELGALHPDSKKSWIYLIIAAISLIGLAFTLGILWHKQQVAKKLGGHSL